LSTFYALARKPWHLIRKAVNLVDIYRRLSVCPPVIVFQMGKVGSVSITNALVSSWPGLSVHTHSFLEDKRDVKIIDREYIPKQKQMYVISLVREPILRNISAFFENFEHETGIRYSESSFSIDALIELFLKNSNHNVPLNWFDVQMKKKLGIDVYQYEFPRSGIQVIEEDNVKLLILRTELVDREKESAIKDFLKLPKFLLVRTNEGADKEYASTYKLFKETFVPPSWYIDKMYNSKYFGHFYDEETRKFLIGKWTKNR
jgi:hypothetical protein